MFFILGALFVISNNNLAVFYGDSFEFFQLYFSWLNKIYVNVQTLTGEVAGFDWSPE